MSNESSADWTADLGPEAQARAAMVRDQVLSLGSTQEDAEFVARHDSLGEPTMTTHCLLHALWHNIDSWGNAADIERMARAGVIPSSESFSDANGAVVRMIGLGVSAADIAAFARMVAYSATFDALSVLDEGRHRMLPDGPEWMLFDIDPERQRSARPMLWLHEAILGADPTGREGRPE